MHFTPTYLDVGFDQMQLVEQDGEGLWDDDFHRQLMKEGLCDLIDLEDQRWEYRTRAPQDVHDCFGASPSKLPEEWHSTTWTADRAVEQLATWEGGNNLLMAGFIKPHHPFDPPQRWFDMYDPDTIEILPGWTESVLERNQSVSKGYYTNSKLTEQSLRQAMAAYYATISHVDHQVGRMVEELKRRGLYDKTLIIYTSDHGDYMGHQHMILKGNNMYDTLMCVPLLIKYPRQQRAGEVRREQVNSLDVTRTILRQEAVEPPECVRGVDLTDDREGHNLIFAEGKFGWQTMVRSATRKILLDKALNPQHLFDLERDPLELNDVLGDPAYAEDVERLHAAARDLRGPEQLTENYRNEDEAVINQPNVPPRDLSHRTAIKRYYAEQVAAIRGRAPEEYFDDDSRYTSGV